MTKHIRILLMVVFAVAVLTGTAAAYDGSETPKNITISENTGKDVKVTTTAQTVGELLSEQGIEIENEDIVSKNTDEELVAGETIKITRALTINFNINSEVKTVKTHKSTVGDVIAENSSILGEGYELKGASESARLYNNMTLNFSVPTDEIVTSTEKIAFETKYVDNADMEEGTEKVTQEGKSGVLEITKKQYYFDGKITKVEEISHKVVEEPVDTIIQVGTKKKEEAKPVSSSNSIDGLNYKKTITMKSTAYTGNDAGCSGRTATGVKATKGIAAVDTSVIPFGTKLYIPGYGIAVAADRGGAIKGNRIDLCYNTLSEAYSWGRRNVTVYVLE